MLECMNALRRKKHTTPETSPALEAPPRKTVIILAAGFIASVAALMTFGEIAEHVVAGTTQAFDDAVRAAVHAQSNPIATPFMRLFTFLGSTPFISICTIALFAMFWRTGRKHRAALLGITIIGATLLMLVLKYSFHRPRPEPFFDTPLPPFDSFPSGHSMVSFCFYAALAALTAANTDTKQKRILIWACCGSLVTMIGLSRIYLGVHWPTDVICAYLAATVWVTSVAFAYHIWKHQKTKRK
jgi:undecaprenyl-diphosphatase